MILQVIDRARRRLLWNALATECAHALNTGMGVLLLILLLGVDLLDWRWLIVLPALQLALGIFLAWRRLPGTYATAQRLDRRLQLADALSTAVFFLTNRRGVVDDGVRTAQWERASRFAARVRPCDAFPVRMPRAIYASALLAVIAAGLFAWRYRFEERLDLRMPMAAVQQFLLQRQQDLAKLEKTLERRAADPPAQESDGSKKADAAGKPGGDVEPPDPNDHSTELAESGEERQADQSESQPGGQDQAKQQRNASTQRSSDAEAPRKQGEQASGNQEAEVADSKSSMMEKVSDTVANLLSVLRPQPGSRNGQQAENRNGQPQESRQKGQKGKAGAPDSRTEAQQMASEQGDAGDGSEPAGPAQAPSSPGSEPQAGTEPGSGAGRQDGDKSAKLAEQLAAMGKLSVILGKRAETISGAASIDVQSSANRLKTQYEQRNADHTQAGATADRDEIPLALQEYVKEYFKQVNAATRPAAARARK